MEEGATTCATPKTNGICEDQAAGCGCRVNPRGSFRVRRWANRSLLGVLLQRLRTRDWIACTANHASLQPNICAAHASRLLTRLCLARSFPSLPQKNHNGERKPEENELFLRCLSGMGGLYASISCTSVFQLTAQPGEQPVEYRGLVKFFNFPLGKLGDRAAPSSERNLPHELQRYLDALSDIADALLSAALHAGPIGKSSNRGPGMGFSTGRLSLMRPTPKTSDSLGAAAPDLLLRIRHMLADLHERGGEPLRPESGKLDFRANILCAEVSVVECVLRFDSVEIAQLLLWTLEVVALRSFLIYCREAEKGDAQSLQSMDRTAVEGWLQETCTRKELRSLAAKATFPSQPPAHNTTPLEWVRLQASPQALGRLKKHGVPLKNSELEQALLAPGLENEDVIKWDAEKWDSFRVQQDLKEEIYVQCFPEKRGTPRGPSTKKGEPSCRSDETQTASPAPASPLAPLFFQPKDIDEVSRFTSMMIGCGCANLSCAIDSRSRAARGTQMV